MNTPKPPCADWKVWIGKEIEGSTDLGALTLFVRNGDVLKHLAANPKVRRVWLCKEFLEGRSEGDLINLCRRIFDSALCMRICVEVTPNMLDSYRGLRGWVNFYVKLAIDLTPGDHICVGTAFNDEAFPIGEGYKVTPDQYLADIFIE